MTCDLCSTSEVAVIIPGSAEERSDLFLLRREEPKRCFCLDHAVAAGCFIYPSEKQPKRRAAA